MTLLLFLPLFPSVDTRFRRHDFNHVSENTQFDFLVISFKYPLTAFHLGSISQPTRRFQWRFGFVDAGRHNPTHHLRLYGKRSCSIYLSRTESSCLEGSSAFACVRALVEARLATNTTSLHLYGLTDCLGAVGAVLFHRRLPLFPILIIAASPNVWRCLDFSRRYFDNKCRM